MADFNFGKLIGDLVSYGLSYVGTVIASTGVATSSETEAITGGIAAIIGIGMRLFINRNDRKMTAITAEANDTQKTTAAVIADPAPVKPVGTAAPPRSTT